MVTTTKYVLRNSDGQFYWKDKSVSSRWGFDNDFNKAYLFDSEKGAKSRLDIAGEGAEIVPVLVIIPANVEVPVIGEPISIPTVWTQEDIKRTPSMYSWASFDEETGEYYSGTSYYDAEGKEITKEEYEALVGPTRG